MLGHGQARNRSFRKGVCTIRHCVCVYVQVALKRRSNPSRVPLPHKTLRFLFCLFLSIFRYYVPLNSLFFFFVIIIYKFDFIIKAIGCFFKKILGASFIFRSSICANNKRYNTRSNTYSTIKVAFEATSLCSNNLFTGVAKNIDVHFIT